MFAEDIFQKISQKIEDITFPGFYSISGYLRNLRGRLLSSEKFSEVCTLWVFTLKPFPGNIYHHHPESKKRKSSEANSGSIHPYGRYGNAVRTRKTISTIAVLWPVKAIFEKRAAMVEVDTFISLASRPRVQKSLEKESKISEVEKLTRSSLKGFLNRSLLGEALLLTVGAFLLTVRT